MSSVHIRGVSARINDETIFDKAKIIREEMGKGYRIIIDNDQITVEGDILDPTLRKRIIDILLA